MSEEEDHPFVSFARQNETDYHFSGRLTDSAKESRNRVLQICCIFILIIIAFHICYIPHQGALLFTDPNPDSIPTTYRSIIPFPPQSPPSTASVITDPTKTTLSVITDPTRAQLKPTENIHGTKCEKFASPKRPPQHQGKRLLKSRYPRFWAILQKDGSILTEKFWEFQDAFGFSGPRVGTAGGTISRGLFITSILWHEEFNLEWNNQVNWTYVDSLESNACNDMITKPCDPHAEYITSIRNDGFGAQLLGFLKIYIRTRQSSKKYVYVHTELTNLEHHSALEAIEMGISLLIEKFLNLENVILNQELPLSCGINVADLSIPGWLPSKVKYSGEWIKTLRHGFLSGEHGKSLLSPSPAINCAVHIRRGCDLEPGNPRYEHFHSYNRSIKAIKRIEPNCNWHIFAQDTEENLADFKELLSDSHLEMHLEPPDVCLKPDNDDDRDRMARMLQTWASMALADYFIVGWSSFSQAAALFNQHHIVACPGGTPPSGMWECQGIPVSNALLVKEVNGVQELVSWPK